MRAIRMMVGMMFGVATLMLVLWLIWVLFQAPILITSLMFFPISILWVGWQAALLAEVHLVAIGVMGTITGMLLD